MPGKCAIYAAARLPRLFRLFCNTPRAFGMGAKLCTQLHLLRLDMVAVSEVQRDALRARVTGLDLLDAGAAQLGCDPGTRSGRQFQFAHDVVDA